MAFRKKLKVYTQAPVTQSILQEALIEYRRPNDKISELLKHKELVRLRRGLYVPGSEADLPIPHLYVIANHLRGPSYITQETALYYWGLIPERVYEINSATLKTSKNYDTPVGRFSYQHVAFPYYSFGVVSIALEAQQIAMIASKEKALCDKIILSAGINLRSVSQTKAFLLEDLRMEATDLKTLDTEMIRSWIPDSPKKSSLNMLVKTLETR